MKYRITEHRNGNDSAYYTVEFLKKNLLWGESWQVESKFVVPKIYIPIRFNSISEVREYIKSQTVICCIVEEGDA
jgi:hypothetical protein